MTSNSADLVGRLRIDVVNALYTGEPKDWHAAKAFVLNAADEIERLVQESADLETLKNVYKQDCLASESKLREIEASSDRIRHLGDLLARGQCTQPTKVGRELKTIAAAIRSQASQGESK